MADFGLGFGDPTDPRMAMARALMEQGAQDTPLRSPWQAVARALQGTLGGYEAGHLQRAYGKTLTDALQAGQTAKPWVSPDTFQGNAGTVQAGSVAPGTTGMDAMSGVLAKNPSTAPMAFQMQMSQLEAKQKIAQALAQKEADYGLQLKYEPQIETAKRTATDPLDVKKAVDITTQEAPIKTAAEWNGPAGMDARTKAAAQKEGKWQILTDPEHKDDQGNTVPATQFRYNSDTAQSTTLDNKPYTPFGAAKLGGGAALSPEAVALQNYIAEGEKAGTPRTAEQIQAFNLSGKAARSPAAAATQKYIQEGEEAGTPRSSEDIAKFGATYAATTAANKAFVGNGVGAKFITSLNASAGHLSTLRDLAKDLKNGDMQGFNAIANAWGKATGNPAPTNFETAKNIIGGEIVKGIVGAGGGEGDRLKAQAAFDAVGSPDQIDGAINTALSLLHTQSEARKLDFTSQHVGTEDDFMKRLTPDAKAALGYNVAASTSPGQAPTAPSAIPQPGTIEGGHRFKGGDPSKPENWEKL